MTKRMYFMSQMEISKELGCTRANVGQTLKRAIKKVYTEILNKKIANSPYEAFECMTVMLNVDNQKDINEIFNKMPDYIKEEIINDRKAKNM